MRQVVVRDLGFILTTGVFSSCTPRTVHGHLCTPPSPKCAFLKGKPTQRSKQCISHLGQTSRCFTDREMEHELSIRNNGICRCIVHFACALRGFGGSLFWAEWRIALPESWWNSFILPRVGTHVLVRLLFHCLAAKKGSCVACCDGVIIMFIFQWVCLFLHCACVVNFLDGRLWRKDN